MFDLRVRHPLILLESRFAVRSDLNRRHSGDSLNGSSQMGASGHSLQFAHHRLQLSPFLAFLAPF